MELSALRTDNSCIISYIRYNLNSAFLINKRRWLTLTVNQVSGALIVSAGAVMQGVQGSNPTDD